MIMRIFVRTWMCLLFVGGAFVSTALFPNGFSTNFQDKLLDARESFENVYYELVKKGHFDHLYNNNLIFNTDFDYEFPRNGAILLALTEWLEQSQDSESQFLLKKLNKFFGLQFHRFICKIDVPKAEQGALSHAYHVLYSHKAPDAQSLFELHPFRTTLTKAMIFFLMVEFDQKNYQQKKESIVYFLEGVRKKLIKINNGLSEDLKVSEHFFEDFINHIETYGLREPLLKPINVKLVVFFVVLGLAVTLLAVYLIFYVLPHKNDLWAGFIARLSTFGVALGENLTKGAFTEIGRRSDDIQAELSIHANDIVVSIVETAQETLQPHLLDAQTYTQRNAQAPARELGQQLAAGAGEGLINGLGRGIFNAPRNMLNAVVVNPLQGAYNYMRGTNQAPQQPPVQQPVLQQPNIVNVVIPTLNNDEASN